MGEKNNAMCSYLALPEIFADFINGAVFDGRKEVCAKTLKESDPNLYKIGSRSNHMQPRQTFSRTRDIVKYLSAEKEYMIIGIENQNQMHYAMPFRCMEYDVMEYGEQIKRIAKQNKEKKNYENSSAYLSGFGSEDRLYPVVTFVFYHGKDTYDSCKTLYEMLQLNENNIKYLPYIPNYKMNLILLDELDETKFQTGFRDLIGIMKHSATKKALQKYVEDNKNRISNLDDTTFDTIGVMINHKELLNYKDNCRKEEGGIDMCQAIMEMIEEGREEGIEEGIERGREEGVERVVLSMLSKGYSFSQINEMTDIPLDTVRMIGKVLK